MEFEKIEMSCTHPDYPDKPVKIVGKRDGNRSFLVTRGVNGFNADEVAISVELCGSDMEFFLNVLLGALLDSILHAYKMGLSYRYDPVYRLDSRKFTFTPVMIGGQRYVELGEDMSCNL